MSTLELMNYVIESMKLLFAEIVETTLVISRFHFLRVGSHINLKRYDGGDTNKN